MADEREAASAGWYPDPAARYSERYWDGSAWTDQAFDHNFSGQDPEGAPTAAPAPRPREREIPEVQLPRRPMQFQRWFLPAFVAFVCLGILGSAGYVGFRHFTRHTATHAAGTGLRAYARAVKEAGIPPTLPASATTTTLPLTGTSAADATVAANARPTVTTTRVPKDSTCGRTAKRAGTQSPICNTTTKTHSKGR
jgi:hypothetical protein